MRVDFNRVLLGFDGMALQDSGKDINLRTLCCNALMIVTNEETTLPGEEKFKRFELASIIHSSKENCDLKVEDIALLKTMVGKYYGPAVVGPAWKLLEGGE
jgi:hypothetical protein